MAEGMGSGGMRLQRGDVVWLIAPASQLRGDDHGLLAEGVSLLQGWGLQVELRVDPGHHFYLAGPDEVRAAHLNAALADPEAKAIFCTRGGYGSARLLQHLDLRSVPPPKLLVGHSDITSLHLAISSLWPQVISIHGPNIATRQLLGDSAECGLNRRSLHTSLFSANTLLVEPLEFIRTGRTSGPLVGGCLSLVSSAMGTEFLPRFQGTILFLEDTREPPYRIDRMLTQLRNAGVFDQVHGVIFGTMSNCSDPYNSLRSVIRDVLAAYTFPIAFGLRSGHGDVSLSIRLGAHLEMDGEAGVISMGSETHCE